MANIDRVPGAGSFGNPALWNPNQVPGEMDTARFVENATYVVDFGPATGGVTIINDQLEIHDGTVTFDLTANTYRLKRDIELGPRPPAQPAALRKLTVTNNGEALGTLRADAVVIGQENAPAEMIIDGALTLMSAEAGIRIGVGASGMLTIKQGASVGCSSIDVGSTARGTLRLIGSGTSLGSILSDITPQKQSTAVISEGAEWDAGDLRVAGYSESAELIVEDAQTRVVATRFVVGNAGVETHVLIQNAATLEAVDFILVGEDGSVRTTLRVVSGGLLSIKGNEALIGVARTTDLFLFKVDGVGSQVVIDNSSGQGTHNTSETKVTFNSVIQISNGGVILSGKVFFGADNNLGDESRLDLQSGGTWDTTRNIDQMEVTESIVIGPKAVIAGAAGAIIKVFGEIKPAEGSKIQGDLKVEKGQPGTITITKPQGKNAQIIPGGAGAIGVVTFEMDFDGSLGFGLIVDIAGAAHSIQYDVLEITDVAGDGGHAILGGLLNVSLIGGFSPTPWTQATGAGDFFRLVTATAGLSGAFDEFVLPSLPPGLRWRVIVDVTDAFDPALQAENAVFSSQPWTGNGTFDLVLLVVENRPPSLSVVGDQVIEFSGFLNLTDIGTFTDPDNGYSKFTYTISWGDGSAPDTGETTIDVAGSGSTPTSGSFDGSHFYAQRGSYTVTVTVTDDGGGSDTKTFNVIFDAAPLAQNDSYFAWHDTVLNVPAPGVLGNDFDPDGDTLTAQLVTGPVHGTVTLNPNGSFVYVPSGSYVGFDTFTYRPFDGLRYGNTATVSIDVQNDVPFANADTYFTSMDVELVVPSPGVLANDTDSDPLTAVLVSAPSHGTLVLNSNGSFNYTPDTGFVGMDSFVYRATDGIASSQATVTIQVTGIIP